MDTLCQRGISAGWKERGKGLLLLLLLLASPTCDIQNGRKSNKIHIEEMEVEGGC